MQDIASPAASVAARNGFLSVRKVAFSGGQPDKAISVHLAECEGLRAEASILVNRMYSWRGYGTEHRLSNGSHKAVFTACAEDQVIGTLTLSVDTDDGLATDHTFGYELDALRDVDGTVLCDLTKFAVDPATKSPPVLAALFHVIFIYGIQCFGCTDVVIEVHPRHVRYYEAMLGFERVGAPKIDTSVEWWPSDTPVQLMRLNLRTMRQHIDRHADSRRTNSRSLYPYFFSPEEERGIARRIAQLSGSEMPGAVTARPQVPAFWRTAA